MEKLKKLREEIDLIDEQLLALIEARINVVKKIKQVKEENVIGIKDQLREEKLLKKLITKAKKKGINKETVEKVWKILFDLSYKIEKGQI